MRNLLTIRQGDAMIRYFKKLYAVALPVMMATTVYGAPQDDYKAFGSIAAVSEQCLGSAKISERINIVVPAAVKKNPEITPIMQSLIKAYNEAYTKAMVDGRVWEASGNGTYGYSRPVNCKNQADVNQIKIYHDSILKALK